MRADLRPLDDRTHRYRLRFGEYEAQLTEADLVHLHDTLVHLHGSGDAVAQRLSAELRGLRDSDAGEPDLECDIDAARKVALAVFVRQRWGKRVPASLAEARQQAFRYLEQEGVIDALQRQEEFAARRAGDGHQR
jgi:hypothetical protein